MNPRVLLAALIGAVLAVGVIGFFGFKPVFAALLQVGWPGFLVLCAYGLFTFLILGTAWFVLLPQWTPRGWIATVTGRIVRESAAEVLPFSQVGGILIGARAAILNGVSTGMAFGSTLVDLTAEMLSQLIFTAVGIALFTMRPNGDAASRDIGYVLLVGLGVTVLAAAGFIVAQRKGLGFVVARVSRWLPASALAHTEAVEAAVATLYRQPGKLALACTVHLIAWFASAIGVWIALKYLGAPLALWQVLAIESLLSAVKSAAFIAPLALGVQEGAYAVIGPLFGLPAQFALALSLLKRARDVAIGLPVILIWQGVEGRRLLTPALAPTLSTDKPAAD